MKYTPELRAGKWFAVDREAGVELACWFETIISCEEIGRRTEEGAEYMTGIPVVPVDSPVPRGTSVTIAHPNDVRRAVAEGRSVDTLWKPHPLNPSR